MFLRLTVFRFKEQIKHIQIVNMYGLIWSLGNYDVKIVCIIVAVVTKKIYNS